MRTIAIASVVLVAATATVTQKAIEAPRPAGIAAKTGLVQQVVCVSAKSCAAVGEWLYTEQAGKWKATVTPTLAQGQGLNLSSLACPAAGKCEAVGRAGEQRVAHLSETGRQWNVGAVDLPSDAKAIAPPSGPSPSLTSVSCSSAGNCFAVGRYLGSDRMTHPLLVAESGGTWDAGTEPQLPANSATTFDPNQPGVGGSLSLVSCPTAGNCIAVGTYSNKDAGDSDYPWVVSESGGSWGASTEAQLPADASVDGNLEVGTSPFFGFTGLSCSSAGNCTAVGGYEDKQGSEEGLILRERNGVWSRGMKAPLPRKGIPYSEANAFSTPLAAVSCAAANDCAAVGWYVTHKSPTAHGLLLSERGGVWKPSAIVLPVGAKAPADGVWLTSVSCPSRGNCVAVGYYGDDHGKTYGLVIRERGDRWDRAVDAAVPKGAAPAGRSQSVLNSVSCPTTTACTAGGYYSYHSPVRGLLLDLRLR